MAKYFMFFKHDFLNVVDVGILCIVKTFTMSAAFNNWKHGIQPLVLDGAHKAQMRNCIFDVWYIESILDGLRMLVFVSAVGFGVASSY